MKLIKTKVTTAEMKAVNAAETTIVTFPYIRGGYRAGQYVVVRIPAVVSRHILSTRKATLADINVSAVLTESDGRISRLGSSSFLGRFCSRP